MQRRMQGLDWSQAHWSAVALLPAGYDYAEALATRAEPGTLLVLARGLMLELHHGELDRCYENWVARRPKVFVSWRLEQGFERNWAVPIQVSVSDAEGARTCGVGHGADGVAMPKTIHEWLGACLAQHRPRRPARPTTTPAQLRRERDLPAETRRHRQLPGAPD